MIGPILYSVCVAEGMFAETKENSFENKNSNNKNLNLVIKNGAKSTWRVLSSIVKGICNLLLVGPPQNEQIENAKLKAMQFRGMI